MLHMGKQCGILKPNSDFVCLEGHSLDSLCQLAMFFLKPLAYFSLNQNTQKVFFNFSLRLFEHASSNEACHVCPGNFRPSIQSLVHPKRPFSNGEEQLVKEPP